MPHEVNIYTFQAAATITEELRLYRKRIQVDHFATNIPTMDEAICR